MQPPDADLGTRRPVAPLNGLWSDVVVGAVGCGIVGPFMALLISAVFLRFEGVKVDVVGMTFGMSLYFALGGTTPYALAAGALLAICSRSLLLSDRRSYAVADIVGAALGGAAPATVPDLAHDLRPSSLLLAAIPCATSGSLYALALNRYVRRRRQGPLEIANR